MADPARPEPQPQETYRDGVDMVRTISNEFGSSPAIVKMQLMLGKVYLDDVEWDGEDNLFIPHEQITDKQIKVIGPERRWMMKYSE